MKNSFKQSYDKKVNPDGSVELRFNSTRWSYSGVLLLPLLLPVSCAATFPVLGGASSRDFSMAWPVVSAVLTGLLFHFLDRRPTAIIVKPGEGIIFDGKSIPFADIKSVGVKVETNTWNSIGIAHIYVKSGGNFIRISGHTKKPELAEAVKDEILDVSGFTWK